MADIIYKHMRHAILEANWEHLIGKNYEDPLRTETLR
jgi:hypothetical protein